MQRGQAATSQARFVSVSDSMLRGEAAGMNWPTYGGAYNNQRYSTLDQITPRNVSGLAPVWTYQTGVALSFETTPVVVDGVMYITTPHTNEVIALNAVTGERLWRYDPKVGSTILCCGPNNRGVAVYDDKVFIGTLDARLIAIDNKTGKEVWQAQVANPSLGYSITAAPLAFDGKVVTGIAGGEYGIRGRITAYDANTGKELWRFYTIPAPNEAPNGWWGEWKTHTPYGLDLHRDIAKEKADSAKYADAWQHGGGGSWMTPAYDPETSTLYIAVGNPSPDLEGDVRPGDNLYTESIVAIDANNGKYKWHFQYIPHGVWDLDATSPPVLFTVNGKKMVAEAGKIGFVYVLDAATGKPILRSENFVPQDSLFLQPTEQGVHMLPGANGGSEWSPMSYSPGTGMFYVMGLQQPMKYTTHPAAYPQGKIWLGSAFTSIPNVNQWGTFSAIDANTGQVKWIRRVSIPMMGGTVATAGGLVFVGEGSGAFDAFDANTGEMLWQYNAGAGVNAAPMTYEVDGVQYVAVAAGGIFQIDTRRGDDVIVFALPDQRKAMITGKYSTPDFKRTPALFYDSVQSGKVKPPSQINTGALQQALRDTVGADTTARPRIRGDTTGSQPVGQDGAGVVQGDATSQLQQYMQQNKSAKTVTYQIYTAKTSVNHGWNFDGYANGDMTLVVPRGWKVTVNFENLDPVTPHTAGIITNTSPGNFPASGSSMTLAFPGSATRQFGTGLGADKKGSFSFTANKTGNFYLVCGVPGHAQSGMWDHFDVSATADTASISASGGGH